MMCDKARKRKLFSMNFFIAVITLISIYSLTFFDTNDLLKDVTDVMQGKVDVSRTKNSPLLKYNNSDILKNAVVDVKIQRLFVLHNFFDGYVWVVYSYETKKNDNDILPSSLSIVSRWKIHRNDLKWEITEIEEAP